jgi:UDP-N-acetylmuramate--alanine ligase
VKFHFIGIGGIGISAIAKYLQKDGHTISGSDIKETSITNSLSKNGINISIPHSEDAITDQDYVIYSAAIKCDNPEINRAKKLGLNLLSRKEFLPILLKNKKVYSVCGAHGKSTTSAILSSILDHSDSLVGAELKLYQSNMRYKKSDILVFEADESDGSFLKSNPYCSVVTNCEPEHMEYYNYDEELFYNHYKKFLELSKIRVINAEDSFLSSLDIEAIKLYPSVDIKNIEYTLIDDEPFTRFELKNLGFFEVWGFGYHIAIDASLAILASLNEIGLKEIKVKIKSYNGIKKRFDIIKKSKNSILIDDYAHHPTEIEATLKSIKQYANLKNIDNVTSIWQPHKYSRTINNIEHFQTCFQGSNKLIILPVWAAGENKVDINFKKKFNSYDLTFADRVAPSNNGLDIIKNNKIINCIDDGVIVGFGAGDITHQLRGYQN